MQPGSTRGIALSASFKVHLRWQGNHLGETTSCLQMTRRKLTISDMSDRRQRFEDQRYVFFLTFSVYRRRNLLDLDHPKRIVLGNLNHQLESMSGTSIGWLPNPRELERFMHGWKRMTSFFVRQWYADHAAEYFREFGFGNRFWQPKYYPFHCYTRAKIEEKLSYMHNNPVRAKLVEQEADWPWSSARWYAQGQSVGVKIEWVE